MSTNRRVDPAIIAAVIGVLGTLCVTIISIYANRLLPDIPATPTQTIPPLPSEVQPSLEPTWTASPTATLTDTPAPTDTVPAGDPTSTPEPPTLAPEATFTLAPPALGSDWANGCISVQWRPYPDTTPATQNNGCLLEPVNVFFAADGRLTFLVNGRFDETQVFGLFAPLPASGSISINVFLRNLQEGEIWMGVFAEPTIESQGTIIVIPPGNVRERVLVQKNMPGQEEVQRTASFVQNPPLYEVVFEFGNGAVSTRIQRDTVFNAVPVGTTQQWFFVGYQVKRGTNRIDAEFLNLVLQGQ